MNSLATVNVVTGSIEIDPPIDSADGTYLINGTVIAEWGTDEQGMSRADEALSDLGLMRTGDWTLGELSTADVAPMMAAYATTVDGYGDLAVDVIPGEEGSGLAPVLTLPLSVDDDGRLTSDLDAMLAEHGYRTVPTFVRGAVRQPGHWTPTAFGAVASIVKD